MNELLQPWLPVFSAAMLIGTSILLVFAIRRIAAISIEMQNEVFKFEQLVLILKENSQVSSGATVNSTGSDEAGSRSSQRGFQGSEAGSASSTTN